MQGGHREERRLQPHELPRPTLQVRGCVSRLRALLRPEPTRAPRRRYEFCWVCLGPWEPHGSSWYNCSRFEEKDSKDARSALVRAAFCLVCTGLRPAFSLHTPPQRPPAPPPAQEVSRQALERYLFYFTRYANHMESKKLERKLEAKVAAKMVRKVCR